MSDKNIKVYIPIDLAGLYSGNPFDTELISALENNGCSVDFGLFRLVQSEKPYDVINFQWPEWIFSGREPDNTELKWLEAKLDRLTRTSLIVVTVHNEMPHSRDTSSFRKLYKLIYKYASGFVHFGHASIDAIINQYPEETCDKAHRVIPHGNYSVFGQKLAQGVARQRLGLDQARKLVLVVGSIRHDGEFKLIRDSLPIWIDSHACLLFRGRLLQSKPPLQYGKILQRLKAEAKQFRKIWSLERHNGVIYQPGQVPHHEMAALLSASDVLFIPRKKILNSGNVPLGFTYGKVVVGPDSGNVGEILRESGNPVYDPHASMVEVGYAIKKGLELADTNIGENNERIASIEWDWRKIGLQYREFYLDILDS